MDRGDISVDFTVRRPGRPREFLVQYARWPHYVKTFAASGYAREMAQIATVYATGDLATAMSASRSRRDSA